MSRSLCSLVGALVTGAVTAAMLTAPAHAIIGGEKADRVDVVQILITLPDKDPYKCSAAALNAEWLVTASHCVRGETYTDPDVPASAITAHFTNDGIDMGPGEKVDRFVKHPSADMALIHVAGGHALPQYARLADSHAYVEGEQVTLYGYGRDADYKRGTWLHRATQRVTDQDDALNAGWVYVLKGVNGGSNHGDSGGPVFADNGELIGVNARASHSTWPDTLAYSKAVQVARYRDWFRQTAGV